jgi:oligoendopeptidase F
MSSVIAARFKEDASYRKEIDVFLTAGSSDTVNNIFKKIGIVTSKPETFHEALERHARDIREFERFVKSQ